jgi:hypothetical protein
MLGHDWTYYRNQRERGCLRCGVEEEYSVDETHEDEGAEKGAMRYRIDGGTLYVEEYTASAWGDTSEYWQWFPVARGPASEENLSQLKQEIEQSLQSDTDHPDA